MGLGSCCISRIRVPAELQRRDRGFGKRLGLGENFVVIGIVGDYRICRDQGVSQRAGPPRWQNAPISLSRTRTRNAGEKALVMWSKPLRSSDLRICEAIVIGFEMRREYRQFAVLPVWVVSDVGGSARSDQPSQWNRYMALSRIDCRTDELSWFDVLNVVIETSFEGRPRRLTRCSPDAG